MTSEEVKVRIGLDSSGLKRGMGEAQSSMASFAKKITAAFAIGEVYNLLKKTTDEAEALVNTADSLGVSTGFLQDLQNVGEGIGIGSEAMQKAIAKFAETTSTSGDLEKDLRGFADALAAINDPAERAAKANEAFGKGGYKLLPMLLSGSKGLDEMAASYSKLSDAQLRSLQELQGNINITEKLIKNTVSSVFSFLNETGGKAFKFLGALSTRGLKGFFNPEEWTKASLEVKRMGDEEKKKRDDEMNAQSQAAKLEAKKKQDSIKAAEVEKERARFAKMQSDEANRLAKISEEAAKKQAEVAKKIVETKKNILDLITEGMWKLRSFSDVSFSEAAQLTDAIRGKMELDPLQLTNQQMDVIDNIRELENNARQARIDGNNLLADSISNRRNKLLNGLGFLPESERSPFAEMNKKMVEQTNALKELLSMSKAGKLGVEITNLDK